MQPTPPPTQPSSTQTSSGQAPSSQPVGAWIGLDWASRSHVWRMSTPDGRVATGEVPNDPHSILEWIGSIETQIPHGAIRILLETKTRPVAHWLAAHPRVDLYVVHPQSLKDYRSSQRSSGAKDDHSDAALLNEYLRKHFDNLEPVRPQDGDYPGLAKLVADRRTVVDTRSGTVAALRTELELSLPEALEWFGSLTTAAAAKFLARWPSLEALRKAPARVLSRVLREDFRWDRDKIRLWHAQLQQLRPAIANQSLLRASGLHVQVLAQRLACLAANVALYDQQIEALASRQRDYALFAGLPGAGKALAPRLMVAFGADRDAWETAQNLQNYTGVAPITKASGRSRVVLARFGCPKFVRQSFVEFARCSVGHSVWAREYFDRQIGKGMGRHAIYRSLAYKWIRILFRCWREHTLYDEARYLAARQNRLGEPNQQASPTHRKTETGAVEIRWKSCGDFKKLSLD